MEEQKKYSVLIGIAKTVKNMSFAFIPALIAFFANVPVEYIPVAPAIVYFLKNLYENKVIRI